VAVEFSASKTQLTLGCGFDLIAKVINLKTGLPLGDFWVQFWWVDSTNATAAMSDGERKTNGDGVATKQVVYPSSGEAYAYYAKPLYTGAQHMASNPLQLRVGSNTTLLLDVSRQEDSNTHTFTCRLVKDDRNGLDGRLLRLKLNETEYEAKWTNSSGYSSWTINLSPQENNNLTIYNAIVSFGGDTNKTAIAYLTTPNGTQYAVCTTIQYDSYTPSSNSTSIFIIPQTTTGGTSLKSLEQMQKEAQANGGLQVWAEFSWWYPWFRLRYAGLYGGQTVIDVGITLWGDDNGNMPDTWLKRKLDEWTLKVGSNILIGIFATETAIWLASHLGPIYFGITLFAYNLYKFITLYANWNSLENLWISLVSTFSSLAVSAWAGLCSFLPEELRALASGAASVKNAVFGFLCKLIMIPINICLLMLTWGRIVELGGV